MDAKMNRETWLNEMATRMLPKFAEMGLTVPPFRVAVAFTSAGKSMKVSGECWHSSTSADKRFEIMISPIRDDSMALAATLCHELIHAAVGFDQGHRGEFQRVALAMGLQKPVTHSNPGPVFFEWVKPFIEELGAIPHAKLAWPTAGGSGAGGEDGDEASGLGESGKASSNAKKKQRTRLVKACCPECGYTVRVTQKWLEIGPPHCPVHGAMDIANPEDLAEPEEAED